MTLMIQDIREFFEAPFFLRAESEELYMLLDGGVLAFDRSLSSDSTFKCAFPRRYDGSSEVALEFRPAELDATSAEPS